MAALSQIINRMKDLQRLASEHHTEPKLYSGDGLEQIHQLLADNQVTRWFSKLYEETYDDHEEWMKMIEFLEKESEFESATTMDVESRKA